MDPLKLAAVKAVHTAIYAIQVVAIVYVVYCGISGTGGTWLIVAIGLVLVEGVVFFANGRRCPLTSLAQKYGDPKGYVGDTFLPERCTQYTFRMFGSLFGIGLLLVLVNEL